MVVQNVGMSHDDILRGCFPDVTERELAVRRDREGRGRGGQLEFGIDMGRGACEDTQTEAGSDRSGRKTNAKRKQSGKGHQ